MFSRFSWLWWFQWVSFVGVRRAVIICVCTSGCSYYFLHSVLINSLCFFSEEFMHDFPFCTVFSLLNPFIVSWSLCKFCNFICVINTDLKCSLGITSQSIKISYPWSAYFILIYRFIISHFSLLLWLAYCAYSYINLCLFLSQHC